MTGVWERQIRPEGQSSCHYYKPIDKSLKDELFRTLMAEVEGVMSSRSFK